MDRRESSRQRKQASGARYVRVLIPPDMVPMLDAMRARHGSGEAAMREGLRVLFCSDLIINGIADDAVLRSDDTSVA